jgi:hypothetical protein
VFYYLFPQNLFKHLCQMTSQCHRSIVFWNRFVSPFKNVRYERDMIGLLLVFSGRRRRRGCNQLRPTYPATAAFETAAAVAKKDMSLMFSRYCLCSIQLVNFLT